MRYIGSKTKLLEEIQNLIQKKIPSYKGKILFDAFSGTGVVGDYFKNDMKIISNDNLYFCYILSRAKTIKHSLTFKKLKLDPFEYFNSVNTDQYTSGYVYNNFAPSMAGRQYFSDENAKMIDFIRDTLDEWNKSGKITEDEFVIFRISFQNFFNKSFTH